MSGETEALLLQMMQSIQRELSEFKENTESDFKEIKKSACDLYAKYDEMRPRLDKLETQHKDRISAELCQVSAKTLLGIPVKNFSIGALIGLALILAILWLLKSMGITFVV